MVSNKRNIKTTNLIAKYHINIKTTNLIAKYHINTILSENNILIFVLFSLILSIGKRYLLTQSKGDNYCHLLHSKLKKNIVKINSLKKLKSISFLYL